MSASLKTYGRPKLSEISSLDGSWSKSWFMGRWQFSHRKSFCIKQNKAGSALFFLQQHLIPPEFWEHKTAEDISGVHEGGNESAPICLHVWGEVGLSSKDREKFELKLLTPFNSFREPHHIIHRGLENRTSNIHDFIKGSHIGRTVPIRINQFEILLSFYESKHTVFLGYNPVQTAEIICKYTDGSLTLDLHIEQLASKNMEALASKTAFKKFMQLDLSHLQS
jgi:hypothetical protein